MVGLNVGTPSMVEKKPSYSSASFCQDLFMPLQLRLNILRLSFLLFCDLMVS